jgi:hypothetical protein
MNEQSYENLIDKHDNLVNLNAENEVPKVEILDT